MSTFRGWSGGRRTALRRTAARVLSATGTLAAMTAVAASAPATLPVVHKSTPIPQVLPSPQSQSQSQSPAGAYQAAPAAPESATPATGQEAGPQTSSSPSQASAPGSAQAGGPSSWLGQEVVLKSAAVVPSAFADRSDAHRRYRVERVDGDWLWITAGGVGGWVRAENVIPAAEAVRYFSQQLDQAPAETPQTEEARAESVRNYNRRAMTRYDQGDFAAAIADYSAAIKLDPTRASLFNNRAAARLEQGDVQGAVGDYTEAIRLAPRAASAYHGRALAWLAQREYDKAIADEDQAIQLRPNLAAAYNSRGLAWFDKGEHGKAVADFDQAIKLDPENPSAFNNRGNVHEARQELDMALADYDAAIRLDPRYARARMNRGRVREARRDYVGALADYDAVIQLDPKSPAGYRGRAWIWATAADERLRDARLAVPAATQACELSAWRDPACLETLAAAEAEAGRFAEAVKRQTEALGLLPQGSPDRASVEARLALYRAGKPYHQAAAGR